MSNPDTSSNSRSFGRIDLPRILAGRRVSRRGVSTGFICTPLDKVTVYESETSFGAALTRTKPVVVGLAKSDPAFFATRL